MWRDRRARHPAGRHGRGVLRTPGRAVAGDSPGNVTSSARDASRRRGRNEGRAAAMTGLDLGAIGFRAHAPARRSGASVPQPATRRGRPTPLGIGDAKRSTQGTSRNPCPNSRRRRVSRRLSARPELCAFRLSRLLAVPPNAPGMSTTARWARRQCPCTPFFRSVRR
jgi:hypothetical protein